MLCFDKAEYGLLRLRLEVFCIALHSIPCGCLLVCPEARGVPTRTHACYALPCAVEVFCGFVFVNFDRDAPPLEPEHHPSLSEHT